MAGAPIVIAYDGSKAAEVALHAAANLFTDRSALVLTAWEPGLGELMHGGHALRSSGRT
jgi:nucleotide-binding universal stress UspA family protein